MKGGKEQFDSGQAFRELPESIRDELEIADRIPDKEFWTEKNLEYWFVSDSGLGTKLWAGLSEMVGDKIERHTPEYDEFMQLIDVMRLESSTTPERAAAAVQARKLVSEKFGIPLRQLTARNILTHAYISEAEAMRSVGFDPSREIPFTLSSGLKEGKRQDAKEVLQKESGSDKKK